MNILRYEEHDGRSLLSETARVQLDDTREFDYLTQIVFRLYEMRNVRVPLYHTYIAMMLQRPNSALSHPHPVFHASNKVLTHSRY